MRRPNRTRRTQRRAGTLREHGAAAGVLSSAGAGVLSIVAGLALLPLIIATIGSGPYGLWLLISAISLYLQYADVGIGSAIVHFGSRARSGASGPSFGEFVSAGFLWNCLVALPVVPLFAWLAHLIASSNSSAASVSPEEADNLAVIGTIMLAALLVSPFASALIGAGLLPVERRNQTVGVVVRCAGTLAACLIAKDVVWLAAAEAVAAIFPHLLAVGTLVRRRLVRLSLSRRVLTTLRTMLAYSIRSFGVSLTGATILQFGTVIVGSLLGPSDVTYYNAAYRVYTAARQLLTWIVDPFRSTLSRQFLEDRDSAVRVVATLCTASLGISLFGAGALIFGSYDVVDLWLGPSVPILPVAVTMMSFLLGYVVNSVQIPLVPAGDALGRPGAFLPIQLTWLALLAALCLPLASTLGIVGVAISLSAPLVIIGPLYVWRARSVIGLSKDDWRDSRVQTVVIIGTISASTGALACGIQAALGFQPLSWLSAATFALTFVGLLLIFRRSLPISRLVELSRAKL